MTEEEIKALIDERCAKIEAKIEAIIDVCNERVTTKFKTALAERLVEHFDQVKNLLPKLTPAERRQIKELLE